MMTDHSFSGRCNMRRSLLMLALVGCTGLLHAGQAPSAEPAESSVPDARAPIGDALDESMKAAEAAYQLTQRDDRGNWLDPTVFTAITPMTVPDVAIRLPADQEE